MWSAEVTLINTILQAEQDARFVLFRCRSEGRLYVTCLLIDERNIVKQPNSPRNSILLERMELRLHDFCRGLV